MSVICTVCDKKFKEKEMLEKHLKTCYTKKEKKRIMTSKINKIEELLIENQNNIDGDSNYNVNVMCFAPGSWKLLKMTQ